MSSIFQVRQAYEENYQQILTIIQEMGGDEQIKEHRRRQSSLYRRLRELQKHEHYLDSMENRLQNVQSFLH